MTIPTICERCSALLDTDASIRFPNLCAACAAAEPSGNRARSATINQGAATALGEYLTYTLSIPERAVRSTIALAGGAAREAAALLVPRAFQSSTTYEIVVRKSLKFLCEDIGGARGTAGPTDPAADFMARKAVGNFVDLAGALTLHMSPLWLLAIVSDVAYGSKAYVEVLVLELKDQGIIADDSAIANMDDVLGAIQQASGRAAGMLDTPPLSFEELKKSLDETRKALMSANPADVLPQAEVTRYWNEMNAIARRDGVSLLEVSSAITLHTLGKLGTITRGTLTGLKVAGSLLNRHVIGHYVESLDVIRQKGFYQTVRDCYEPYIDAVWHNFSPQRATWTGELVTGRLPSRIIRSVRDWFKSPRP